MTSGVAKKVRVFRAVVAAALTLSASAANAYTYNTGPNWVNMSGASCRGDTATSDALLQREAGAITVGPNASITATLWCPLQRRGTSFYELIKNTGTGSNRDLSVTVGSINVSLTGTGVSGNNCSTFVTNVNTGSTLFSATKHLCSTVGGCASSPSPVYVGTNTIALALDGTNRPTVNFGVTCNVARGSKIQFSQTTVTPNP